MSIASDGGKMGKPVIFIVEDEQIVAEDLKETLKDLGFTVAGIEKSGEIAIEKVSELHPDLVLMDIHLAGKMDGIETAGLIRSRFNIPIIYLTAYADKELLERAKITEPYGYILKPYVERELNSVIEMALYKHSIDEKIKEHDRTIRALINATPDAMLLLDNDGGVLAANETMASRLNRKSDDLLHLTINDLLQSGSITVRMAEGERIARSGKPVHFIEELKGRWFENNLYPIFDSQAAIIKIAIYSHDITAMKDAEHEREQLNLQLLKEKEDLLRLTTAFDGMDDCVVITNSSGQVDYANAAFEKRFGYTLAEFRGKHFSELQSPENQFVMSKEKFINDTKMVWTGNFSAQSKFGVRFPTTLKSTPIKKDKTTTSRVFVLREQF
jgi:PAS domain S-box-containing protein